MHIITIQLPAHMPDIRRLLALSREIERDRKALAAIRKATR